MSLLVGNKTLLRFRLLMESAAVADIAFKSPAALFNDNCLNSTPWMGKEPGSCRVVHFKQSRPVAASRDLVVNQIEFEYLVGYRPAGWISDVRNDGEQRLNGWRVERRDQTPEGVFLDGRGKPLPLGAESVYLGFDEFELADYNETDFGHFVGEEPG